MVSWCCMCRCNGETKVHLLIHCSVAFDLWSHVFQMFGIQWVLPEKVLDSLCGWWIRGSNFLSAVWNLVPLCVLWPMDYLEGNKSTYLKMWSECHSTSTQLLASFISSLYEWSFALGLIFVQNFIKSIHM